MQKNHFSVRVLFTFAGMLLMLTSSLAGWFGVACVSLASGVGWAILIVWFAPVAIASTLPFVLLILLLLILLFSFWGAYATQTRWRLRSYVWRLPLYSLGAGMFFALCAAVADAKSSCSIGF